MQFVQHDTQVSSADLSVPTSHRFQYSIMDKSELVLRAKECVNLLIKIVKEREISHLCLHHLHSLSPHLVDDPRNINELFLIRLLQNHINGNEGASATHPSTAQSSVQFTVTISAMAH